MKQPVCLINFRTHYAYKGASQNMGKHRGNCGTSPKPPGVPQSGTRPAYNSVLTENSISDKMNNLTWNELEHKRMPALQGSLKQ